MIPRRLISWMHARPHVDLICGGQCDEGFATDHVVDVVARTHRNYRAGYPLGVSTRWQVVDLTFHNVTASNRQEQLLPAPSMYHLAGATLLAGCFCRGRFHTEPDTTLRGHRHLFAVANYPDNPIIVSKITPGRGIQAKKSNGLAPASRSVRLRSPSMSSHPLSSNKGELGCVVVATPPHKPHSVARLQSERTPAQALTHFRSSSLTHARARTVTAQAARKRTRVQDISAWTADIRKTVAGAHSVPTTSRCTTARVRCCCWLRQAPPINTHAARVQS